MSFEQEMARFTALLKRIDTDRNRACRSDPNGGKCKRLSFQYRDVSREFAAFRSGAPPPAPTPRPAPTPEPTEQFTLINGVQIFPSQTYDVTITRKGIIISSGPITGKKLIEQFNIGGVEIEIGVVRPIEIVPTLTPQNPFIRIQGEKFFLADIEKIEVL